MPVPLSLGGGVRAPDISRHLSLGIQSGAQIAATRRAAEEQNLRRFAEGMSALFNMGQALQQDKERREREKTRKEERKEDRTLRKEERTEDRTLRKEERTEDRAAREAARDISLRQGALNLSVRAGGAVDADDIVEMLKTGKAPFQGFEGFLADMIQEQVKEDVRLKQAAELKGIKQREEAKFNVAQEWFEKNVPGWGDLPADMRATFIARFSPRLKPPSPGEKGRQRIEALQGAAELLFPKDEAKQAEWVRFQAGREKPDRKTDDFLRALALAGTKEAQGQILAAMGPEMAAMLPEGGVDTRTTKVREETAAKTELSDARLALATMREGRQLATSQANALISLHGRLGSLEIGAAQAFIRDDPVLSTLLEAMRDAIPEGALGEAVSGLLDLKAGKVPAGGEPAPGADREDLAPTPERPTEATGEVPPAEGAGEGAALKSTPVDAEEPLEIPEDLRRDRATFMQALEGAFGTLPPASKVGPGAFTRHEMARLQLDSLLGGDDLSPFVQRMEEEVDRDLAELRASGIRSEVLDERERNLRGGLRGRAVAARGMLERPLTVLLNQADALGRADFSPEDLREQLLRFAERAHDAVQAKRLFVEGNPNLPTEMVQAAQDAARAELSRIDALYATALAAVNARRLQSSFHLVHPPFENEE